MMTHGQAIVLMMLCVEAAVAVILVNSVVQLWLLSRKPGGSRSFAIALTLVVAAYFFYAYAWWVIRWQSMLYLWCR